VLLILSPALPLGGSDLSCLVPCLCVCVVGGLGLVTKQQAAPSTQPTSRVSSECQHGHKLLGSIWGMHPTSFRAKIKLYVTQKIFEVYINNFVIKKTQWFM